MKHSLSHFKILTLLLGAVFTVVAYQNCGVNGGFAAAKVASTSSGGSGPAASPVTVDPVLKLKADVPALSNVNSMVIGLGVDLDPLVKLNSVSCQVDLGTTKDCTSLSLSLSGLSDGDHTVLVSAVDSAGHKSNDLKINFKIDATPPLVTFSQTAPAVSGSNASFAFTGSDLTTGVSAIECALDAAAYAACASPMNLTALSSGAHTLKVRAKDGAGNMSAVATSSWMVDTSAPSLVLATKPNANANSAAALFSFSGSIGSQVVGAFQCSLDGSAFAACVSPVSYSALSEGAHTFKAQGRDLSGIFGSPLTYAWKVDLTSPVISITSGPMPSTLATTASFVFAVAESGSGLATIECQVDAGAYASCASPFQISQATVGNHSFRVRATDLAGNQSTAMSSWVVTAPTPTPTPAPTPTPTPTPTPAPVATPTPSASTGCTGKNYLFCEDFESGTVSTTKWNFTAMAVPPTLDSLQSRGTKAWHIKNLSQEMMAPKGVLPAVGGVYYGRMYVYFGTLPKTGNVYTGGDGKPYMTMHWSLVSAQDTNAKDYLVTRIGGAWWGAYTTNPLSLWSNNSDGVSGDWELTDTDPGPNGSPVPISEGKWICMEWMHSTATNEIRIWVDNTEKVSLYSNASITAAVQKAAGYNGYPPFVVPLVNTPSIGYVDYYQKAGNDLWIDDIALDTKRIGCSP